MSDALKDGRFVILGSLGEGAQGHTFDGVDRREGRAVAIKRFDVRSAKTWKDAELAEREARVLQSLSHPKLPKYFDHFEQDGALYLVMEKIEGESLAALRKRGAILSEEEVVRLLRDASDVLEYLHSRAPPVIHRDLKPGNVLRRPDGSFAFVDFGAVRDKLRQDGGSTVVGTFGFMAPEQFQGRALPASDVYAIGATALSMLTGSQPEDLPHKGLAIDVRAAIGARVSPRLVDGLVAMLDPDPDRRASRIAPILSRLEERGSSGRGQTAGSGSSWKDAVANSFLQRAERYEELAREFERRAVRGGPAAKHLLRQAKGWYKQATKWRIAGEGHRARFERQVRRRGLRLAEKEMRRMERSVRRPARGDRSPPWPVVLLFSLGLLVAMLAVALATQVVVPVVLHILSRFFAQRGLSQAAVAVRDAGRASIHRIERARHELFAPTSAPRSDDAAPNVPQANAPRERVRVTDDAGAKVRVDAPQGSTDEDDEAAATDTGAGTARR